MKAYGARATVKLQQALLHRCNSKNHDPPLPPHPPLSRAREMWIVSRRRAFLYAKLRVGQDCRAGRLHAREHVVLDTNGYVDMAVGERQRRFDGQVDDTLEAVFPCYHARPGRELDECLQGVFASGLEGSSKRVCPRVICVLTVSMQR